jgi:hypothetical protein
MRSTYPNASFSLLTVRPGSAAITLTVTVTRHPSNLYPVIHKDDRGEENARGNIFQDADGG